MADERMAQGAHPPEAAAQAAPRSEPRWRLTSLQRVAGAIVAIIAIGFAQVAVGRGYAPFSWPGEAWLNDQFFKAFGVRNSLAFATPLFFFGAALFGAVALRAANYESFAWPNIRGRLRWPYLLALGVSAGTLLWLIVSLFLGDFEPAFRFMFVSGIGSAICVLFVRDFREGRLRFARPRWLLLLLELVAVAAVVGTFIGINIRDLRNWRYLSIGDEGGFFFVARRILSDSHFNWFSVRGGVFDDHPVLGSVWHAINLLTFGSDIFGWKMGALTAIAITLPVFYVLLRELFNARAAVFATMMLGASHYLFAYAHTGYNNIFPIFPTTAALACLIMGMKRGSPAFYFLCGVFAGLGFYTFYSARATIFVIGFALLATRDRRTILQAVTWIAPAFAFTVLPLFGSDRIDVFTATSNQSFLKSDVPLAKLLGYNFLRSLFAFNFNPFGQHYAIGALMDGVSATLAVAGLGLALAGLRRFRYQVLLIWFGISLTVAGILSRYDFVSVSRLHYALPPMAAFAGLALDAIVSAFASLSRRQWFTYALTGITIGAIAPTVFILNGRQFFIYSAEHWPTYEETVIYREVLSKTCADSPSRTIIYSDNVDSVLDGAYYYFGWENKRAIDLSYSDAQRVYGAYGGWGGLGCTLVGSPNSPPGKAVQQQIESNNAAAMRIVTDLTGLTQVGLAQPSRRGEIDPSALAATWKTDFSRGTGLAGAIQAQSKHFLPSLDSAPLTISPNGVPVGPYEPAVVVRVGGQTRAYGIRFLMWHGVVNDVVGGEPIVVTYDPIAGAARAFDRRVGGQTYTFAVSGFARNGNALLYDLETESWWQELSGGAVTGALAGAQLQPVESQVVSNTVVNELYNTSPAGLDAMGPQLRRAEYARNPYLRYEVRDGKPVFTLAPPDDRLRPLQRVLVIDLNGTRVAVPLPEGRSSFATTIAVLGQPVVLFFDARTQSELDARMFFDSRAVGSLTAFETQRSAVWSADLGSGHFVDGTGSRWDSLGDAVEGPAKGSRLTPVVQYTGFWFSVSSVFPNIQLHPIDGGESGR